MMHEAHASSRVVKLFVRTSCLLLLVRYEEGGLMSHDMIRVRGARTTDTARIRGERGIMTCAVIDNDRSDPVSSLLFGLVLRGKALPELVKLAKRLGRPQSPCQNYLYDSMSTSTDSSSCPCLTCICRRGEWSTASKLCSQNPRLLRILLCYT